MKLWIGNIKPETTDEEIRAFVGKYASDFECTTIERVPGDGSRPAAVLEFPRATLASIEAIAKRLHGMYWMERQLHVQAVTRN